MKELLVADDHRMIRKGLIITCQKEFGINQIDEASSCNEIMVALKKKRYTHAIFDMVFTDGTAIEILPNIRNLYPDLRILILSMQSIAMYRSTLERYEVRQFISKAAPERETLKMLQDFIYNAPESARRSGSGETVLARLTPREVEVLHYLLEGKGSNEIADAMNMKQNTISTFKRRIFEKSNTKSVLELKEWVSVNQHIYDINS
jgi:two-component system, NarL family, invasion response regulator UvrY